MFVIAVVVGAGDGRREQRHSGQGDQEQALHWIWWCTPQLIGGGEGVGWCPEGG